MANWFNNWSFLACCSFIFSSWALSLFKGSWASLCCFCTLPWAIPFKRPAARGPKLPMIPPYLSENRLAKPTPICIIMALSLASSCACIDAA
uniref:Uncharacterized protein n=1 Tax=uncultured marine virus TaxID=186617 RepID=A0A0F7L4R3_9VIRU|nr:hypothetical protein [uncultured marine virus]